MTKILRFRKDRVEWHTEEYEDENWDKIMSLTSRELEAYKEWKICAHEAIAMLSFDPLQMLGK